MVYDSLVDTREIVKTIQSLRRAEEQVSAVVGPIPAMDSEFGVWREGLKRIGASTNGLQNSAAAARAIFIGLTAKGAPRRKLAQDSAADRKRLESMFPNMNRLGRTGW